MAKEKSKYLFLGVLVLLLGVSVFLFVRNAELNRENFDLTIQVEKTDSKAEAIKTKYTEQKALAASMQRGKMAADSKLRTLEAELSDLAATIEALEKSRAALEAEIHEKQEAFSLALEEQKNAYNALNLRFEDKRSAFSKAEETIRQQEAQLAIQENDNADLTAQLEEALSKIDRVVGHNQKLVELSMELLGEFDDRNVFQSLLEKEPFTQAKRVELEKMIQAYLDRIDDEVLTESEGL